MPKKKKEKALTPEQLERQRALGRMRMRALARMIVENSDWLYSQATEGTEAYGENVMHNIAMLLRKKDKGAGELSKLSLAEKQLMRKFPSKRTAEEKYLLYRLMGALKCFKRYPKAVSRQLSAYVYYAYYKPDKVIIREGRNALALYYILEGDLLLTRKEFDPVEKKYVDREVGNASEGDILGEMALLHQIPWGTTVTTLSKCEVLFVLKRDFNNTLRSTVQSSWDKISAAMEQFSYFRKFDAVEMKECCVVAKVKSYEPSETIYGYGSGSVLDVYFILSGKCKLVEYLKVEIKEENGYTHYKRLKDDRVMKHHVGHRESRRSRKSIVYSLFRGAEDTHDPEWKAITSKNDYADIDLSKVPLKYKAASFRKDTFFVQICDMRGGCLFGLENNYPHRGVIASTQVICLLVPRHWLMEHHRDIWEGMKHMLNTFLPDPVMVYKKFVSDRKWDLAGQRIMSDTMSRAKLVTTDTSESDIPRSIRLNLMAPEHEQLQRYT